MPKLLKGNFTHEAFENLFRYHENLQIKMFKNYEILNLAT